MKFPVNCKRILLMHMRKAGGTTTRRVLEKVSDIHGIAFFAREGHPLCQDDLDEETFVVMNIRHPFDRTCSLFNASGLWRRLDKYERSRAFDEWLAGEHSIPTAPPLWLLPRNLYVRSVSNCSPDNKREMTQEDYHAALVNLRHIDLLWICDWLKFKPYGEYLSSRLLGPGKGLINFPHDNQTVWRHGFDIRQELQPQQIEAVRQANRWDMELYQYACCQATQAGSMEWPGGQKPLPTAIPGA